MAKRVSLTAKQRETAIGAELLALCQSITDDGRLSGDEIKGLIRWLRANNDDSLPGITFLVETVKGIIADGVVTVEERRELLLAIEKVLPPDLRKQAAGKRKEIEAAKKAREREQKAAEREAERQERLRNAPIKTANFMVAGVYHEGRPAILEQADESDNVFLARDRANSFSRNAIRVVLEGGECIGFVPDDLAVELAPLLDSGARVACFFTKFLTRGRVPIPVVQAYFYRADSDPLPGPSTITGPSTISISLPEPPHAPLPTTPHVQQELPAPIMARVEVTPQASRAKREGLAGKIARFLGF